MKTNMRTIKVVGIVKDDHITGIQYGEIEIQVPVITTNKHNRGSKTQKQFFDARQYMHNMNKTKSK